MRGIWSDISWVLGLNVERELRVRRRTLGPKAAWLSATTLGGESSKSERIEEAICLLIYLAGLPHRGSPLLFPIHPHLPKIVRDLAYIPGWRERPSGGCWGATVSAGRSKSEKYCGTYMIYLF